MKKGLTITLIAVFSALVIFLVVIMCVGIVGNKKWDSTYLNSNLVFEETYRESEIESFNILVSCGDIRFIESENSKINVKIFSNKKYDLSVNVVAKELNISLTRKGPSIKLFNFGRKIGKDVVLVSVPKTFGGKIFIVSNLGDFFADDLKDASVDIEADLGTVSLGKIKDAKITSSFGDVKIDEVLNWLDIDSSLGDVEIKSVDLNKNSKIKCALGDVRIKKAKGVCVDVDVALGNKRINDNDKTAQTTLYIDSALGDVEVN